MKRITAKERILADKHRGVVGLYKSGKYTTEQIANNYALSVRQVQRIAKKAGVIRTQAEANKIAAPLKKYRTVPLELRVKRKHLRQKQRYETITAQPYCSTCGRGSTEGLRLEVDHVDENPENNSIDNLQVLCQPCNKGKSDLARFGSAYATS